MPHLRHARPVKKPRPVPLSFLRLEDRVTPATLVSDLLDYAPGSTAYFTGSGFGVGETIDMVVLRSDGVPEGTPDNPWTVTDGGADDLDGLADGNFLTSWYVDPAYATNQILTATAAGQTSGETANLTFTDGTGSINITLSNGTVQNANVQYSLRTDVYFRGANFEPGTYYVYVYQPQGDTLIGRPDAANPVTVGPTGR